MKTRIASLFAVWCSALSAAALAYAVHRPVEAPAPLPRESAMVAARAPGSHRLVSRRVDRVIEIPEQVIVSYGAGAEVSAEAPAAPVECSGWRSLRQGPSTQQVRDCRARPEKVPSSGALVTNEP
jgi:hypothetical protein